MTIVKVSRSDIKNGKSLSPFNCPVARALKRAGIKHDGVVVSYYYLPDGISKVKLPRIVSSFIKKFDTGKDVQPFEFKIN